MSLIEDKKDFVNYSNKYNELYLERVKVKIIDGQVCSVSKEGEESIPVALYASIILGPGTSITAEAAKAIYKRGASIIFSGGAGLPVYGMTVNYRNPKTRLRQYEIIMQSKKRLKAAKYLLNYRAKYCKMAGLEPIEEQQIKSAMSIGDLLLVEARWTKNIFKILSKRSTFGRDYLKLLNHFAYSAVVPAIHHFGLDINIGVLHGKNRGGGLLFDLADVMKTYISYDLGYSLNKDENPNKIKALFLKRINDLKINKHLASIIEGLYFDDFDND